jgi:hypothetical protein
VGTTRAKDTRRRSSSTRSPGGGAWQSWSGQDSTKWRRDNPGGLQTEDGKRRTVPSTASSGRELLGRDREIPSAVADQTSRAALPGLPPRPRTARHKRTGFFARLHSERLRPRARLRCAPHRARPRPERCRRAARRQAGGTRSSISEVSGVALEADDEVGPLACYCRLDRLMRCVIVTAGAVRNRVAEDRDRRGSRLGVEWHRPQCIRKPVQMQ